MLLKDFLQKYNLDLKSLFNNFDWYDVFFQYCYSYGSSKYYVVDNEYSCYSCMSYKQFISHIDNFFIIDDFMKSFLDNCYIDIIYRKSDYCNYSILNDSNFNYYMSEDFSSCKLLLNYFYDLF